MRMRRKSALEAFEPCARYADALSRRPLAFGSVIGGERIEVVPPSTSLSPAAAPAAAPVTRSLVPLTVVPSCLGPLLSVACGSPRFQRPVVALSPLGEVQPESVSN